MKHRKRIRIGAFEIVNGIIMTLVMFLSIYPMFYALINSLNEGADVLNHGMVLFYPRIFTLDNWRIVLTDNAILKALWITVSRTVIVTTAQLLFTSMFAYGFSRNYLIGKKFYIVLGFISMYISGGIIATFLLLSRLGLYNTYMVYIIPSLFGGFYNVIIYTSNFRGIPADLFESAKLDGAGEFTLYWKIVLPLSKAILAALGVFTVVAIWNDYSTSLFYTSDESLQTLQYYIVKLVRNERAKEQMMTEAGSVSAGVYDMLSQGHKTVNSLTLELAAMVIAAMPMIVMYPFAQKFFTKGVLIGSIKG